MTDSSRVCGLVLAATLFSLPAEPARRDSITESIDRALSHHPSLRALESALEADQAAIDAAGAWPDPQFSWSVAPDTYNNERLTPRHIYGISQRLPWPGKRQLDRQAQRRMAAARADELVQLRLELSSRVRQLQARWLYLEAALQINADNQALVDDLARVALSAYAAGHSPQPAVTEAQLRQAVLHQDALQLGSQLEAVRAQWRALLADPDAPGIAPAAPAMPPLPAEETLLASARRANPELAALDDLIAASADRQARALKDYWPDLTLKASYVGTLDPDEKRSQIGLSVDIPLDLARRRGAAAAAAAQHRQLRWQRADRLAKIEAEISSVLAEARATDEQLTLYQEALLPHARSNLDAARSAWRAGQGDFAGVIASEEQLLRLRMGQEAARRDALIHRSILDRLSGGLLTDSLFGENP